MKATETTNNIYHLHHATFFFSDNTKMPIQKIKTMTEARHSHKSLGQGSPVYLSSHILGRYIL